MSLTFVEEIDLLDHHCHGLVDQDLDDDTFRELASESDWPAPPGVDSLAGPFGLALRRLCAPVLDLEPHVGIGAYLQRRQELGHDEVNRRLLSASGIGHYLVETGFPRPTIATPDKMAELSGRPVDSIVRLEAVAEQVARDSTAEGFMADFEQELRRQYAGAVGLKTVVAYRDGLGIAPERPEVSSVTAAVGGWLARAEHTGSWRLEDPVILHRLIWSAVDLQAVIQVHVGFGDADVQLNRADPSLMTPFLRATRTSGARFVLLHCYPFVREAGVLAHLFPHVWFDVSCLSHYAGPSAPTLVRHALEVAPFGKVLFASDAYGIPEHYLVSATTWRRGLDRLLAQWVRDDWLEATEAAAYAQMMSADNARALYELGERR